jgi:ABC-type lipoprotein export system ATPase subunit
LGQEGGTVNITVKNLNKTYKAGTGDLHILQDIELTLNSGEWLTIVGPSGSGKSSLLHCIAGIEAPDRGSHVQLGDFEINNATVNQIQLFRRNKLGFVYQDYKLFEQFDSLTNVVLPLIPYESKDKLLERGKKLLEKVQLSERMNHMPSELSGGEKQRVAIARAILNDPELLICDEPTGNLDERSRDTVMEVLRNLNKNGKSVILVTHDRDIISKDQRVMSLKYGRLTEKQLAAVQ